MEYPDLWAYLRTVRKPIYLYGMGNGADTLLQLLTRIGVRVRGVFASDEFVRYQSFHGFSVTSYAEARAAAPHMLILVAFGSSRPEVMANIARLAREQELYAPALPLFGGELFTAAYARAHARELAEIYARLADEASRLAFRELVAYKLHGDIRHLFACETPQAEVFSTFFHLRPGESYADLGAYTGDTIAQFAALCPQYRRIYGMEPDARSFRKLLQNTKDLPRTTLWNTCCTDRPQFLSFCARGGRNSSLGEGRPMPAYPLDSILDGTPISYLKMDVEGQEAAALEGARRSIAAFRPKMLVYAYHRSEDLFALPLRVLKIRPDYRIYLRHHPYIPEWDTNYYFV